MHMSGCDIQDERLQLTRDFLFWTYSHLPVQGLAGLFQAPADLLHRGTFDEARNEAQEKQLWLVSGVPLF